MAEPSIDPYERLAAPLRAVLDQSYADRVAGRPGAELNLANAWWSPGAPATSWEALARVGPTGVNVIVRIYDRIAALDPSLELWRSIRYIRNVWWGGSAGFKVVWSDPARALKTLDALFPRVARDGFFGGVEHQRGSALKVLASRPLARWLDRAGDLPDATTFREVSGLGAEAVHLCVGRRDPRPPALDDVHLDWRSPVRGVDRRTRRCVYAVREGARHWLQAMLGWGAPCFPFDVVDRLLASGGASPAWADLAARWEAARWPLALRGAEGHTRAMAYVREAEALSTRSTASA